MQFLINQLQVKHLLWTTPLIDSSDQRSAFILPSEKSGGGGERVCVLASYPGPTSQLFNVTRKKAGGGPGIRRHVQNVIND